MKDMELVVSKSFYPLLDDDHRYLVMCGGAGSGKSEFAARKIFYRCETEGRHRYLVMRKIRRTLDDSAVEVMRRVLAENDIAHEFNKSDLTIAFAGPKGMSEVLFMGLDDPEKIKSIKGITSIWLEEATEFSKEDFLQIDLRLRDPGPLYRQIMLTFNPLAAQAKWLKEMFFGAVPNPDAFVHRSTVEDNPIAEVRDTYRKRLEALRDQNPTMYQVYGLGEWAALSGQIYQWPVDPLPDIGFDEVWYGGDFGYSVDEAAIVKIYRKADEFWLKEVLYRKNLTNQMLAEEMKRAGIDHRDIVYFDSAEPKSIEELRRAGLNVYPCDKGPDSVRAGIDFLKSRKIHIVEGSANLNDEASTYCWRVDKNDDPMPEPVKMNDHCFVAGTMVETKRGAVSIEAVTTDDYALTRRGYRQVVASGMTAPHAEVMTAHFSNGKSLTGTPNHPVWIHGCGFIPLDTMRYGDIIEICQTNALSIKGFRTEDIQVPSPTQIEHTTALAGMRSTEQGICTGRFGRTHTAKYQLDITSIIRTAIRQTIRSTTLRCASLLSTVRNKSSIALTILSTWLRSGRSPWLGIALGMVGNGTGNTPATLTRSVFRSMPSVTNAALCSKALAEGQPIASAPTSVSPHGDARAGRITRFASAKHATSNSLRTNTKPPASVPVYVLRVDSEPTSLPVYNLTVSEVPEFYANGILVHNCLDAARYGIFTHCGKRQGRIISLYSGA